MEPLLQLKQDSIFKRRKRKRYCSNMLSPQKLLCHFIQATIILLYFSCDMSPLRVLCHLQDDSIPAAAAHNQHLQQQQSSSTTNTTTTTINNNNNNNASTQQQRFLEEPKNTTVVLGEQTRLTCLVENKRGSYYWTRNQNLFSFENTTTTIAHNNMSSGSSLSSNEQQLTDSTSQVNAHITDASLLFSRIQLADEALYECVVDASPSPLVSSPAQLIVLKPPTQLSINAQTFAASDAADAGELNGSDDFNSRQLQSSSELIIASAAASGSSPPLPSASLPATSSEQVDQQSSNSETIERIIVKQNTRLRLECRSDEAKPHAELVWLDHQQRQVSKTANLDDGYFNETSSGKLGAHHTEWVKLAWTFKVHQRHHDQVLTCQAQHPAFESRQVSERLFGRELRRQVRLEVQYEPEIELIKDQLHLNESATVTFRCLATARPAQLTYRWFIDDQLIANATEPELRIDHLTRQLHLRELKCQVSNAVGSSQATLRLAVRYAAHYVTHLLPPSLQPPIPEPQLNANDLAESLRQVAASRQVQRRGQVQWPSSAQVTLARQLALGFDSGQDVQLRCDFDANPRPQQVLWYKVSFNWTIMQDITPERSAEFIAGGAGNAIFRRNKQAISTTTTTTTPTGKLSKRHIAQTNNLWTANVEQLDEVERQLDYERMSAELISELAELELNQSNLSSGQSYLDSSSSEQQHVEPIATQTPTPTTVSILEPIGWRLINSKRLTDEHHHLSSGSETSGAGFIRLQLLQPNSSSDAQVRLITRETQVSSSYIILRNVNDKSIGRYVCATSANSQPLVARAVHLVQRSAPRLISVQEQFAPLGSRQLQVECLVQINTVADNRTAISWFKDGKLIENTENRYRLQVDYSPDLLFMRSTLLILNADFYDFGLYNCTVQSAFPDPQDYLPITLRPSAPTGFVFALMAFFAVGSVVILLCVIVLLLICGPIRHLNRKAAAQANQKSNAPPNLSLKSNRKQQVNYSQTDAASQSSDRKSLSNGDATTNEDDDGGDDQNRRSQMSNQHHQLTGAAQLMSNDNQQQQVNGDLRHSLAVRLAPKSTVNFAAIHESLEHKLQLGQPPPSFARAAPSTGDQLNQQQVMLNGHHQTTMMITNQQQQPIVKNQAISELERSSLLNRLLSRLLMRPAEQHSTVSRSKRVKSRPLISMPVNNQQQLSGDNQLAYNSAANQRRRPSLSTSLSLLSSSPAKVSASATTTTTTLPEHHLLSNTMSHSKLHTTSAHLVSSSANLIQDSTTASSDNNTASSGRCSSNSSSNESAAANQNAQNHELTAQNAMIPTPPHLQHPSTVAHLDAYAQNSYLQQSMWLHHQQQQQQQQQLQSAANQLNEHYVNQETVGAAYLPIEMRQVSPNYATSTIADHLNSAGAYSNSSSNWSDQTNRSLQQQQQQQVSHYQLPMMASSADYLQQQPAPPVRPCYATICQDAAQYNAVAAANYGTLPLRCHHQVMVPTSNAGEDYFDSHYDTLISESSAYKTLYAQTTKQPILSSLPQLQLQLQQQPPVQQINGCLSQLNSTNSNSPNGSNSNNSSSSNNNATCPGALHVELKLSNENQHQQQVEFNLSNNIVAQADNHLVGSSAKVATISAQLVAKQPSDNGEATHV